MELVVTSGGVIQDKTDHIIVVDWDEWWDLADRYNKTTLPEREREEVLEEAERLIQLLRIHGYGWVADELEDFATNHLGDD